MKRSFVRVASSILFLMLALTVGCTSFDEPAQEVATANISTRTQDSDVARVRTVEESVQLAKELLGKSNKGTICYSVDYILAKEKGQNGLLSDTIAYVINFGDKDGYAVICNDTRVNPALAYAPKGNMMLKNGTTQDPLLSGVEDMLRANISSPVSSFSCTNSEQCVGHTHAFK